MVLTLSKGGVAKLFLYKDGSSDTEIRQNAKSRSIGNSQVLVVSLPGSGKSNLVNFWAWSLWKEGYTVVYVSEKEKSSLENAFCAFSPKEKYQTQLLETMGLEPEVVPIKVYHPFCFTIPERQQYPDVMELFTIPLTDLSESAIASIIASGAVYDSTAVRLCINVLSRLSRSDSIWDFLRQAYDLMKVDSAQFSKDPRDMGMPIPLSGDMRDISKSVSAFSAFWDYWFLQDKDCPMNINMRALLNDSQNIHFFTAKWITNERMRYFYQIALLNLIDQAIASGEVRKPIVIILEEIKILLPKNPEISYQKLISEQLRKMISGIRSQGRGVTTIATTQTYYQTNIDFRSSVDSLILGKLNFEDIKAIYRDYDLNKEQQQTLATINRYEWVRFEHLRQDYCPTFRSFICPFALKEEKYPDFFRMWSKEYPTRLKSFGDIFARMREKRDVLWKKQLQWLGQQEALIKRIEETKRAKEKLKEGMESTEVEEAPEEGEGFQITSQKNVRATIQLLDKMCFEKKKDNPDMPFTRLRKELQGYQIGGTSTLQRMIFREGVRQKAYGLLREWFTKKYVFAHYPNQYLEVFPEEKELVKPPNKTANRVHKQVPEQEPVQVPNQVPEVVPEVPVEVMEAEFDGEE